VSGLDKLVIPPDRKALCVSQCHLELGCQFVHSHGDSPPEDEQASRLFSQSPKNFYLLNMGLN